MLYSLARLISSLLLGQFFYRIRVKGDITASSGPLIIVSNHPNLMLDPALLAKVFKRRLYFVAKATLFANPLVGRILRALHLIPIYRKQDGPSETHANDKSFAEVSRLLRGGEAVVIFPEGTSQGDRTVHPLKTGTARMAFQADQDSGEVLNLEILPVGITYSDLFSFRSSVTITFGEIVYLDQLRASYKANQEQAVRDLTETIENRIKSLTVSLEDSSRVDLVEKISRVYAEKGYSDDQQRFVEIAKNVESDKPASPEFRAKIEQKIDRYVRYSESLLPHSGDTIDTPVDRLSTVLLSPFVILGVLICWLPYRATRPIAERLAPEPVYRASAKLLVGAGLFVLWFTLIACFLYNFFGTTQAHVLFGLVLFSAWAVNKYQYRVWLWLFGRGAPLRRLREMRDQVFDELEGLRNQ